MTYEFWRIGYQSSEQAARCAWAESVMIRRELNAVREALQTEAKGDDLIRHARCIYALAFPMGEE